MYKISRNGEKFLREKDVASAISELEQSVNNLSSQVNAFVVKNSVKLLIRKWFSDVITKEKNQKKK